MKKVTLLTAFLLTIFIVYGQLAKKVNNKKKAKTSHTHIPHSVWDFWGPTYNVDSNGNKIYYGSELDTLWPSSISLDSLFAIKFVDSFTLWLSENVKKRNLDSYYRNVYLNNINIVGTNTITNESTVYKSDALAILVDTLIEGLLLEKINPWEGYLFRNIYKYEDGFPIRSDQYYIPKNSAYFMDNRPQRDYGNFSNLIIEIDSISGTYESYLLHRKYLENHIRALQSPLFKILSLLHIVKHFHKSNTPINVSMYSRFQIIEILKKCDLVAQAELLTWIGQFYSSVQNTVEGFSAYSRAEEIYSSLNNNEGLAYVKYLKGNMLSRRIDSTFQELAGKYFYESNNTYNQINDPLHESYIALVSDFAKANYLGLDTLHDKNGTRTKLAYHCLSDLAALEGKTFNFSFDTNYCQSEFLLCLGNYYGLITPGGNSKLSIEYYNTAIVYSLLAHKKNGIKNIQSSLVGISRILANEKNPKAIYYNDKAIQLAKKSRDDYLESELYLERSLIFQNLGETENALNSINNVRTILLDHTLMPSEERELQMQLNSYLMSYYTYAKDSLLYNSALTEYKKDRLVIANEIFDILNQETNNLKYKYDNIVDNMNNYISQLRYYSDSLGTALKQKRTDLQAALYSLDSTNTQLSSKALALERYDAVIKAKEKQNKSLSMDNKALSKKNEDIRRDTLNIILFLVVVLLFIIIYLFIYRIQVSKKTEKGRIERADIERKKSLVELEVIEQQKQREKAELEKIITDNRASKAYHNISKIFTNFISVVKNADLTVAKLYSELASVYVRKLLMRKDWEQGWSIDEERALLETYGNVRRIEKDNFKIDIIIHNDVNARNTYFILDILPTLLQNSIDHAFKGERLYTFIVKIVREGNRLMIEVKDDGDLDNAITYFSPNDSQKSLNLLKQKIYLICKEGGLNIDEFDPFTFTPNFPNGTVIKMILPYDEII